MQDPITNWEAAIVWRIEKWSFALLLLVGIGCLFAPIFEPLILKHNRRRYVMEENYEELARRSTRKIRPWLWVIASIAWGFVVYANAYYKGY